MPYRDDTDLEFLGLMTSQDLADLAYCLMYDKEGRLHLSQSLKVSSEYRRYGDDYVRYWQRIAEELQTFGANSLASFLRGGKGVRYAEILRDICDNIGISYNKDDSAHHLERCLISFVLTHAIINADKTKVNELSLLFKKQNIEISCDNLDENKSKELLNKGGFEAYCITLAVVNAIWNALFRRGVSIMDNPYPINMLNSVIEPINWMLTSPQKAINIAGPAYSVTVPAVFQIALLRSKFLINKAA